MWGDLPPSSSVTVLRLDADICTTSRPVTYSPVKAILSTSGCWASAAPAVGPKPGTTLRTPSGRPASAAMGASSGAVIGVWVGGLRGNAVVAVDAGGRLLVGRRTG